MDRKLKTGLVFMGLAVLFMPLGMLLKNVGENAVITVFILAMILELIGLFFVVLSIFKQWKSK